MIGAAMVTKSARFLAPIALASVAVAVYLLVHASLVAHNKTATQSTQSVSGRHKHRHRHRTPKVYVVKAGDTLSAISVRLHIPVFRITALNPGISPNALRTGQRLRLRR
jgi:LysM repeat protein